MNIVEPIRSIEKLNEFENALKNRGERDYVMFMLGTYTGLRISDILKLKVKDVKNTNHIYLKEQKTGKRKVITINPVLKRVLKDYTQNMEDDEYLIKSRQGNNSPLSRQRVYDILNEVADTLNVSKIGTHTLRKTFGYHFYQQTKDVAILQEIFNHSSPNITRRYIGIDQDVMDKAIGRFRYKKS